MAEAPTKLQVKKESTPQAQPRRIEAFDDLQRQVNRLFEDFGRGWDVWRPFGRSMFDLAPTWSTQTTWAAMPAVDVAEKDKAFEITAELPGMEEKNIEVKVANSTLTIKGEKKEEREEKEKDYYVSERRFGSFQRSFGLPEGVDADKIEANFKNGVLTITLPKTADAQKQEKTIAVKAA